MTTTTIPDELRYTVEHEWARANADGTIDIGVTDYAQDSLGDITYVELPAVGTALDAGATFGVIESVKTFSDLFAPVSGTVVAVNSAAVDAPGDINGAPYEHWLIRVQPSDGAAYAGLLDAAAYRAQVEAAG